MRRFLLTGLTERFASTISRRQLLQRALQASAGALLCDLLSGCCENNARPTRRVIIVGAGLAGLACAHELMHAGYSVKVLEARNRIGGRVLTLRDFVPGKTVEAGGEFIGVNHPTWMAFARKLNLELLETNPEADRSVILDGARLSQAQTRELTDGMKAGAALLCRDAVPINADEPWTEPAAAKLDRRSLADAIAALDISPLGKRGLTIEFTLNAGLTPERASYLAILATLKAHGLEKYWTDTETHRCSDGSQQLADHLARDLGPDRLSMDKPVRSILVKAGHVEVVGADGRSYKADDVVLAIPPSVWHKVNIEPPLPAELNMQMGVNVKYLAAMRQRFWRDALQTPNCMSDGNFGWTWEATDGQSGDAAAALVSFAGGPAAAECRRLAAADRLPRYRREFERRLPGFAANFVRDQFLDWPGDPWTLGSYSFPAPGQLIVQGPLLRGGLDRLHFAGEHTSKFRGFMEGALHSGVTLAHRLARRDGILTS